MTLHLHLQIVGTLLAALGLSHVFFNRIFGWDRELAAVSLLTRRVFFVHTFFIGLGVVMAGAITALYAGDLLMPSPLSRGLLACSLVFWLCRLVTQLFVYDKEIWRGHAFFSVMHVLFSILWIYVVTTYGLALRSACGAS
jgi:hypothetical protein